MRSSTLLVLLAATMLLPGCRKKEYHRLSDPISTERDTLWSAVRRTVGKRFEIDETKTNKTQGVLQTRWKVDLSTDYLRTYRRMVDVALAVHPADEDKPEKDQRWQVQLSVVKEVNENIAKPLEAKEAKWGDTDFDEQEEQILLAEIRMEVNDIDVPEPEPLPTVLPASKDGKWVETLKAPIDQSQAWDALLAVARDKDFKDKLLQPQVGRYESDWRPTDYHEMDQAKQRCRLVALVVPETSEGKTQHKVQVRVERQYRDREGDEWRDGGRDEALEQAYGLAIDERLIEAVMPK